MAWTWPVLFTRIRVRSEKPLLPRSTQPTSDWSKPKTTLNLAKQHPHRSWKSLSIRCHKTLPTPRSGAASANATYFSVAKSPPGCFIIHIILRVGSLPTCLCLTCNWLRWSRTLFSLLSHWKTWHDPRARFYVTRSPSLLSRISHVTLAKEL